MWNFIVLLPDRCLRFTYYMYMLHLNISAKSFLNIKQCTVKYDVSGSKSLETVLHVLFAPAVRAREHNLVS